MFLGDKVYRNFQCRSGPAALTLKVSIFLVLLFVVARNTVDGSNLDNLIVDALGCAPSPRSTHFCCSKI